MSMEAKAKPTPAAGQRWFDGRNAWVLTERSHNGWRCHHDTDPQRTSFATDGWLETSGTYLGSPPVAGARPEPAIGVRLRWAKNNVYTLFEYNEAHDSWRGRMADGKTGSFSKSMLADPLCEFLDGPALTPAPTAAPAPVVTSKPVRHDWIASHVEARTPIADGLRPASRIGAVPARKPPGPWQPSVDEYDLLPDAGTSYSSSGRGR